jgi:hypothetical protein
MKSRQWLRLLCVSACLAQAPAYGKELVGWLESAKINSIDMKLVAKLDTGAKTTSLGYSAIAFFQRDGRQWVSVSVTDKKNQTVVLEKKLIRSVTIKQHVGELPQQRPVILLGICLKHIYKEVEVDLMDRAGFNYTLLLGRNFLANDFVVDPASKFTQKPNCKYSQGLR